jgi:hypothetical protein
LMFSKNSYAFFMHLHLRMEFGAQRPNTVLHSPS